MEYALNTRIEQEIFIDADEDDIFAVKYTITITNTTADADAEAVTVKAVLGENLSWYEKDDDTEALYFIGDISNLTDVPQGYDLDELTEYVENHIASAKSAEEVLEPYASAVVWADQTIAAGEEKEYVFYAMAAEGITTTDELSALYFVDGEQVENTAEDQTIIEWKNEELLAENETEAETETEGETETENKEETETRAETETDSEIETEVAAIKAESEEETAIETENQTEEITESGLESEAETESVPKTETESEAESETELETETEIGTEPELETETSLTYDGGDYTVTVTYGSDARLPEGVELLISEYANDSETWLARYAEAAQLYALETFRLFSIGLYVDGEETEPAAAVSVAITLPGDPADAEDPGNEASAETVSAEAEQTEANAGNGDASEINTADAYTSEEEFLEGSIGASVENSICVIHFGEESGEESASVLEIETEYSDSEQIITFSSDSFSDYGIAVISDEAAAVSETEEENAEDTISTNLQALINLAATATANVQLVSSMEDASGEETTTAILTVETETNTDTAVITLYADFTENLEIPSGTTVTIDLNGHTIAPAETGSGSAITVNGTLTLTDSSSPGTTNSSASAGTLANSGSLSGIRGVLVASGGSFTLDGGTISGFSTSGNGGGVLVNSGGSFTMTGGTIANNTASGYGGGIYLEDASNIAAFTGGTVSGNTASRGGGVAFMTASDGMAIGPSGSDDDSSDPAEVDTADKVLITKNTSTSYGGGIYAVSATKNAVIQNTVVSYNTSAASGGGVYFPAGSSVSIYYTNADNNVIYGSGSMTGGGICVESSTGSRSTLVMVGGTASSNTVTSTDDAVCYGGGVGMGTCASATITDVTADGNSGVCKGGGIAVGESFTKGEFTNLTVTNNIANSCASQGGDGGGLWTGQGNSTAVISGGIYAYNCVYGFGGGVYLFTNGKITGNAKFYGNTSKSGKVGSQGGGVFCRNLTIENETAAGTVEVYENTESNGSGGGICAYNTITVEESANLKIHGNEASSNGGGIYIGSSSGTISASICGCVDIYDNSGSNGGGIYIGSKVPGVSLSDSVSVHDNTATGSGGGIYVSGESDNSYIFSMTGGSVYNNTAVNGGGLAAGDYSIVKMTGGTVTENTASTYGGGVWVSGNSASFELAEDTVAGTVGRICDNIASLGQDVYAAYTASYANTALTLIAAADMFDDTDNVTEIGWLDETTELTTTEMIAHNPVKRVYPLTLSYISTTTVAVVWNHSDDTYDEFTTVQAAVDAIYADKSAEQQVYYSDTVTSPEIILVDNARESVEVSGGTVLTLNLNGYLLKGSPTAIGCYGTLTIQDMQYTTGADSGSETYCEHYDALVEINKKVHEDETDEDGNALITGAGAGEDSIGTITGSASMAGGGVHVYSGGYVTMISGQIADCVAGSASNTNYYGGAGVCVESGTFILGGTASINNCTTKSYGSAVYITAASGVFILQDDAVIEENSAYRGTVAVMNGTFQMTGGTIQNNTVTQYGGGVYVTGGTFRMSGGTISSNTTQYGGGVFQSSGTVRLTGGTISGNTVTNRGGGIYLSSGTMTLSGVTISENVATSDTSATNILYGTGGGIYVNGGTLSIRRGTVIFQNTANRGGGVYQYNGTITMSGGQITRNSAEHGGGLAQYPTYPGTFTLSGGVLCDNTSTADGLGNDVYSMEESGYTYSSSGVGYPSATLMRAADMDYTDESYAADYNVWRDDNYSGDDDDSEGETINSGHYVTGTIVSSHSLQLTADKHGDTTATEAETTTY
ncbi:MAG: hypothetical protein LUI13_09085 [Lachnospiraceae bacterium]|nr:hypothetical protein [Lachnospiraceae bacterium]